LAATNVIEDGADTARILKTCTRLGVVGATGVLEVNEGEKAEKDYELLEHLIMLLKV